MNARWSEYASATCMPNLKITSATSQAHLWGRQRQALQHRAPPTAANWSFFRLARALRRTMICAGLQPRPLKYQLLPPSAQCPLFTRPSLGRIRDSWCAAISLVKKGFIILLISQSTNEHEQGYKRSGVCTLTLRKYISYSVRVFSLASNLAKYFPINGISLQ